MSSIFSNPIAAKWMQSRRVPLEQTNLAGAYLAQTICGSIFGEGQSLSDCWDNQLYKVPMRFSYPALMQPVNIRVSETSSAVSVVHKTELIGASRWIAGNGPVLKPVYESSETFDETLRQMALISDADDVPYENLNFELNDVVRGRYSEVKKICEHFLSHDPWVKGDESFSFLVLKGKNVLFEQYGNLSSPGRVHKLWSLSKVLTAMILGRAEKAGLIDTDETGILGIWADHKSDDKVDISWKSLLKMSSGLQQYDRLRDGDIIHYGTMPVLEYLSQLPASEKPGQICRYSNVDILALGAALRQAFGDDKAYTNFPYSGLFYPLGMDAARIEKNIHGDYMFSNQAWASARDMAKIGCLCLNTDDLAERFLPKNWISFLTKRTVTPPKEGGKYDGFAGQFWLPGEAHGMPPKTLLSMGANWQFLLVVPEFDMVLVLLSSRATYGLPQPDVLGLAKKIMRSRAFSKGPGV